jgi:signal transduction histidine kinase
VGHAPGDDDHWRVSVADDGIGFDVANAESGFGLSGLTERLALVCGELTVQSSPGSGTTLVALLPTGRVSA